MGITARGSDDESQRTLREALNRFRRGLSGRALQIFQTGSSMQMKCACARIQRDQERLLALSNLRRMEHFILRLEELENILKLFSNGDSYTSYVWGAMQFLFSVRDTFKDNPV